MPRGHSNNSNIGANLRLRTAVLAISLAEAVTGTPLNTTGSEGGPSITNDGDDSSAGALAGGGMVCLCCVYCCYQFSKGSSYTGQPVRAVVNQQEDARLLADQRHAGDFSNHANVNNGAAPGGGMI